MSRKRTTGKAPMLDPIYRLKQKATLRHTHRETVRFNEPEMAAIREYCRRYNITSRGPALRRIIMEAVLKGLDQSQPTLF